MNDNVSANEALRYRRLSFYAEDVERFNHILAHYLTKANATCALLIDKEGHTVAKQGFLDKLDTQSLAALVAGSFASTRQVAKLLGEPEFNVLFHQGSNQNIHITLVGERTLQVSVFSKNVKTGMIQVLSKELAEQVQTLLNEIENRAEGDGPKEELSETFSEDIKDQLDNLFGDL